MSAAPSGLSGLSSCRVSPANLNSTSDARASGTCLLCGPQLDGCVTALSSVISEALSGSLAAACGSLPSDLLTLTLLRDQGRITCRNAANPVATRQPGVMSLQYLTQCSGCGVIACPAGHYCAGGTSAPQICPQGYYCAGGAQKRLCPAGYYCPQRSSEPLKCRAIADCPEGSHRENVWVPFFVSMLLLVIIVYGLSAGQAVFTGKGSWLTRKHGSTSAVDGPLKSKAGEAPSAPAAPAVPRIGVRFADLRLVTRGNVRMDGVSGSIKAGRLTAIMGGSGAGKTTLSSLLLGKETPTAGSVTVEVHPPTTPSSSASASASTDGSTGGNSTTTAPAFEPFSTTMASIRNAVGVVPQVDVMNRELTVRQVVSHSGFTRLPGSWTAAQKRAHIESVLRQMELTHVVDCVIGNEAKPGISGGEIKRVNIALELAANPGLLVLDEPTTGLDATAAYKVIELLQETARRGITVVCVIHQPRQEILELVDDLILLGRGGRSIYQGPMAAVTDYFSQVLSYACPQDTNASDFIMDVLEARYGAVVKSGEGKQAPSQTEHATDVDAGLSLDDSDLSKPSVSLPVTTASSTPIYVPASAADLAVSFASVWANEGQQWVAQKRGDSQDSFREATGGGNSTHLEAPADAKCGLFSSTAAAASSSSSALPPPTPAALRAVSQPRPSIFAQTYAFTKRALIQHVMGAGFLMDCLSLLLGGCVMGIVCVSSSLYIPPVDRVYFNSCPPGAERLCKFQLRVHLEPATFYISICVGVLCIPAAVRALGAEREIYWREASVGVNRLAYYLGKILAEIPKIALLAFFFVAPLVAISHWRAPVELLYFAVLVNMFFIYALGFCVSAILVAPDAANLFGVNVVSKGATTVYCLM